METRASAQRWARVWEEAWRAHDIKAISGLYADGATYRSHPFRSPEASAATYVGRVFPDEREPEPRFGQPLVDGDRAAVEWWTTSLEGGKPITLAGCTILRFNSEGLVTEHQDYWHAKEGRIEEPPA